jgi:DNA polymerase
MPSARAPAVRPLRECTLPTDRRGRIVRSTEIAVSDRASSWQALRAAAAGCRECPLGERATQTVWGDGALGGALMLVGEQPGDREDIEGKPFVGPAGQLLGRAIDELGWRRDTLYVTNAVKHFKYELRGKRRMHKTPGQLEMLACRHWLESEIDTVRPRAIVALGAVAARALLGRPVKVLSERGRWQACSDGVPVLVTVHPASLLRGDPATRQQVYRAWLDDLARADDPPPRR